MRSSRLVSMMLAAIGSVRVVVDEKLRAIFGKMMTGRRVSVPRKSRHLASRDGGSLR